MTEDFILKTCERCHRKLAKDFNKRLEIIDERGKTVLTVVSSLVYRCGVCYERHEWYPQKKKRHTSNPA